MKKTKIEDMEVIIHFPEDEETVKMIYKEIAAFRCAATINYMDSLGYSDKLKLAVVESIIADLQKNIEAKKSEQVSLA